MPAVNAHSASIVAGPVIVDLPAFVYVTGMAKAFNSTLFHNKS